VTTTSKVTKSDLEKSFWIWGLHNHVSYNFEVMQAGTVCWSMVPLAKKLYADNPEKKKEMLHRELEFFNTEINWGSAIVGLAAAMEVQLGNGEDIDPELITSLKTGLMGPMAGIGDTITQAIVLPLVCSIFMSVTISGNPIIGPIMAFVLCTAYYLVGTYWTWHFGYNRGSEAILDMLESGVITKIIEGAGIMGCMVMGSLLAQYVRMNFNVQINSEFSQFDLQSGFFDAILPKALPLALVFFCLWLMNKKGWKTSKVVLLLFVCGWILGALGILA